MLQKYRRKFFHQNVCWTPRMIPVSLSVGFWAGTKIFFYSSSKVCQLEFWQQTVWIFKIFEIETKTCGNMSLLDHQRCGLPTWRSLGGIAEPPQPQRVAASGASELLEGTGSFNLYAQMWGSCYFNGSRNGISFIFLNGRIIHVQSQSSCILALKEHRDMVESCLHTAVLLEQRQHVTMWQTPKLSSNWPYPWFLVVHRFLVQTKNYSAFDHQGICIIPHCGYYGWKHKGIIYTLLMSYIYI